MLFDGRLVHHNEQTLSASPPLDGLSFAGRGFEPLDDGNILTVNFNSGVRVHNPITGSHIRTVRSGFGIYSQAKRVQICWIDIDGDNDVDIEDLLQCLRSFGNDENGDTDRDGDTDIDDLLRVLVDFGTTCP